MNNIDEAFETLRKMSIELYKSTLEFLGEDFGPTNNEIVYRNYLANSPIFFDDGEYENGDDNSEFIDYNGPVDGSIGSSSFPQGKGKCLDPYGRYWPFYTFGIGASPKKRPDKAQPQRSGVDCCKLIINKVLDYMNKGCKTIGDVICMYHTGMPTYQEFIKYYNSRAGINDIADGRFVSSAEMIHRQNYYQKHLVEYVHMSNTTPMAKSYKILFPLITFISRQEQGINCEEACKIALQQMGIS